MYIVEFEFRVQTERGFLNYEFHKQRKGERKGGGEKNKEREIERERERERVRER